MDSTTASRQAFLVDQLSGFDPLAEGANLAVYGKSVFEEATQRVVQNILKSYTGYFDIFSELLQNSLDAIDKKVHAKPKNFIPRLWIKVDIANRKIRIVDNGSGMGPEEIRFCFRPNVSFKNRKEARGNKGVGATFLAYGFGSIRLSTKTQAFEGSVRLVGGRQWADDYTHSYPRPRLCLLRLASLIAVACRLCSCREAWTIWRIRFLLLEAGQRASQGRLPKKIER